MSQETGDIMLVLSLVSAVPAGSHGSGSHSKVALILVGIVFVLVGGLQAARPQLAYKLNSWQYKRRENWEPSRAGLIAARIGGSVFAVLGVVLLVIGIAK